MKTQLTAAFASAAILAGCNPSNLDGKGEVTLAFEGSTDARQAARILPRSTMTNLNVTDASGSSIGTLTLSEAWVVIQEIELEHESEVEIENEDGSETEIETETEIEFVGPFALDVLSGTTYPALPSISIDTGVYDDIEIDFEKLNTNDLAGMPNLPQGIADKLVSFSIYLEGSYSSADGTTHVAVPFSLAYDHSDEFELSGTEFTNGFTIDDTGINDIIVAFRLNEWFRFDNADNNSLQLTLEDAIADQGNGVEILLDGNVNNAILDIIEDNIEDSAEYGEDEDDDGELDEDEDDDED